MFRSLMALNKILYQKQTKKLEKLTNKKKFIFYSIIYTIYKLLLNYFEYYLLTVTKILCKNNQKYFNK
jgi:hypothetical protein